MNTVYLSLSNGVWDFIIFLLTGALIGYLAAILFGSKKGGLIKFVLIGIVGSYIGGLLSALIFDSNLSSFMNYVMAVLGSGLLIIVLRFFKVIK